MNFYSRAFFFASIAFFLRATTSVRGRSSLTNFFLAGTLVPPGFFSRFGFAVRHIPELDRERSEVSRYKGVFAKDLAV